MAKRPGSAGDPLWYKDAVIYELHVRAFKDSNGDGIGDFPGLIQKLDYLQDLGVTFWIRNMIACESCFACLGGAASSFLIRRTAKSWRSFGNMRANRSCASPISPASRSPSIWICRRWRA